MKLSGKHEFALSAEEVYARLLDPDRLRECMPGCERLEATTPEHFELSFSVPIPAVTGTYDGTVDIVDAEPPTSFRMQIEAEGKSGFVKADAQMRVEPTDAGAILHYEADAQIGGAAASVGQRIITGMSRRQVEQMMRCLEREKLGALARFVEWVNRIFRRDSRKATA